MRQVEMERHVTAGRSELGRGERKTESGKESGKEGEGEVGRKIFQPMRCGTMRCGAHAGRAVSNSSILSVCTSFQAPSDVAHPVLLLLLARRYVSPQRET